MPERIYFAGIDETRAALKDLGDVEATKEFKAAGRKVAQDIVVKGAQERASTPLEQRAAETLRASMIATGGAVRFGAGFPAAFGAEFGAFRNQNRTGPSGRNYTGLNQFQPWRGSSGGAGYFLWPTIRDEAERIVETYATELGPLWRRLFPEEG